MHVSTLMVVSLLAIAWTVSCKTIVSIQGTQFYINNKLTNAGSPAAGLLINSKMTQAIFDDENSATVGEWNYPDTHEWNATRNTLEFVSNVTMYSRKGLNAVTVGMQGSNPDSSGKYNQACNSSGFTNMGEINTAWAERLQEVIAATDQERMILIITLFDLTQEGRVSEDDGTIVKAVQAVVQFLVKIGATNVMLDLANSCSTSYTHQVLTPNYINTLIKMVQAISHIPVSTSFPPGVIPPDSVIETADFLLLHSSGLNGTGLTELIQTVHNTPSYKRNPIPIIINEDSTNVGNLAQAVYAGVSWGYFSPGQNNYKDGYNSPPIDWAIDTVDKRAFFTEVGLVTQQ